jgi:hypothetical protein
VRNVKKKKGIRLEIGQLKRKDLLVKSDNLNKDIENKRKIVKKKKKRRIKRQKVNKEVSKKINLLYYKLNQLFIIS